MQAAQNNNGKKKAVLFVDDEKIVLEVGSLMLQKLGYRVLAVSNGNSAIEVLKENKVVFVLLNLLMPGMNGFEIYHKLKRSSLIQKLSSQVDTQEISLKNDPKESDLMVLYKNLLI